MKNFIKPEQFPYKSALDWEYDSGDYGAALKLAMDRIGYNELKKEQAEKRAHGELMRIGISSFTEIVGAGPSKHFDILGLKMFDSAEIRVHPTGKVIARFGAKSQGQGHETTYAQIVAEELGFPVDTVLVCNLCVLCVCGGVVLLGIHQPQRHRGHRGCTERSAIERHEFVASLCKHQQHHVERIGGDVIGE